MQGGCVAPPRVPAALRLPARPSGSSQAPSALAAAQPAAALRAAPATPCPPCGPSCCLADYAGSLGQAALALLQFPPDPLALLLVAAICAGLTAAALWMQSVQLRVPLTFYRSMAEPVRIAGAVLPFGREGAAGRCGAWSGVPSAVLVLDGSAAAAIRRVAVSETIPKHAPCCGLRCRLKAPRSIRRSSCWSSPPGRAGSGRACALGPRRPCWRRGRPARGGTASPCASAPRERAACCLPASGPGCSAGRSGKETGGAMALISWRACWRLSCARGGGRAALTPAGACSTHAPSLPLVPPRSPRRPQLAGAGQPVRKRAGVCAAGASG